MNKLKVITMGWQLAGKWETKAVGRDGPNSRTLKPTPNHEARGNREQVAKSPATLCPCPQRTKSVSSGCRRSEVKL